MAVKSGVQQLGVIVFGNGLDHEQKIKEAKAKGYEVKIVK